MKELRIPKERVLQFIRREAAAIAGVSLDQLGVCAVFMQTDERHEPLDVIVDYEVRDPHNWFGYEERRAAVNARVVPQAVGK